ncbi:2-C-methyl-D-erythritol 4-phosphate cytidylyltransferase [Bifidobacterium dolichotidis]|uniref:2-C-methyl-D-erythritol 4-phosphate cytidylyltransferase n=1 Tax=Bifidobacterium dolichotidis TaxID=2306976 RepID=A0A430FSR7_9BIFI|nr:IspD/TarI family cytidylyltransferase [Bifidobacterium dolichotidis]RSX55926.1 2-C-methyl-D-erythritol 4-phosphate cytidylyltransferase [Bifidobacterium dolichotidis]
MTVIAMIIAGGRGVRMKNHTPKQFLHIFDKPMAVYTLEAYEKHPGIDEIEVVCLDGWQDVMQQYGKDFGISKLVNVTRGGADGQSSIRNGLESIASRHNDHKDEVMVLVCDANRPMVSEQIIDDCIRVCQTHGNATASVPCATAVLHIGDQALVEMPQQQALSSQTEVPRHELRLTQTPQAFYLDDILDAHHEAEARGITGAVASCTLYAQIDRPIYFSEGSDKNLKLTTPDDIDIFKALLVASDPEQYVQKFRQKEME